MLSSIEHQVIGLAYGMAPKCDSVKRPDGRPDIGWLPLSFRDHHAFCNKEQNKAPTDWQQCMLMLFLIL